LTFRDWISIELRDEEGSPIPNESYTMLMPDGTERKGTLDGEGRAREEDVPPGACHVMFPNVM
jgi:uncharacterized protein (DUF2345 family)